jgi:signal transduction histidine kinase
LIKPDSLTSNAHGVCGTQCGKVQHAAIAKAGLYQQVKEFFSGIFDTGNWPARWHCGTWSEFHGWLYIFSDLLIAVSYFAIPLLLIILLIKRKDVPFPKILWLFVVFIVLCGLTHFIDAGIFWWPAYRLSALLRLLTGMVSVTTVYALYRVMPVVLSLRSVKELQKEINERKIAEEKLAASEFLLLEAGRMGKFGGWEMDLITNKVTWSKGIYDIHELPYDFDPTFYDASRFYPEPYFTIITRAVDTCRNAGKGYDLELQLITVTNHQIWIRTRGELLYDEYHKPTKLRGVFMDIDKYKLNELSLNKTVEMVTKNNQQLKNFTHILSHNIRNHASNISLVSSLVDESTLDEENAELFQKIKKISEGLNTTLEDLSHAIKIKDEIIETERINFEEITDKILGIIESDVTINKAVITQQFEVEEVTFPKIYMESILMNLLNNAIKYRKPTTGPKVLLKTYRDENGNTVLECTDNGIGIDMKLHEKKIFGLYKTFHDRKDSHGVGLFLTKTQVDSQGGQITLKSKPNSGSTFKIIFNEKN